MSKTRRKPKEQPFSSANRTPSPRTVASNRLPDGINRPAVSAAAHDTAIVALIRVMLAQLNFFRLACCGFRSRREAVAAYARDRRRLFRIQRELHELLIAALVANIEGRMEGPNPHEAQLEQAMVAKLHELLEQLPFRPEPIPSRLTGELIVKPLGHWVPVLEEDLAQGLVAIAERIVKALKTAVEHKLLGRVEWHGPTVCKFEFFKDVILQTGVTLTASTRPHTVRILPGSGFLEEEYHRQIQGVHEYQKALHYYELLDAKRYPFPGPEMPLPPKARGVLDSTAIWLRPLVTYVRGTQFRERIMAQDIVQKAWTETEVDRVTFKGDPAITIFDCILTAWTDAEQKAAVRQHESANQSQHTVKGFFSRLLNGK